MFMWYLGGGIGHKVSHQASPTIPSGELVKDSVDQEENSDDWEEIGGDPQPDGLTAEEEELVVHGGEEEEEEEDNDDEKYDYGYEEEESERGDEEEDEVMKEIWSEGDDDDMDPLDEYGEL